MNRALSWAGVHKRARARGSAHARRPDDPSRCLGRAGNLDGLGPTGAASLAAHGIRTVIDLRCRREVGRTASVAAHDVAVGAIADADPGGVVEHCQGGSDRTGLVVALVLRSVGVRDDDVLADYLASIEAAPADDMWRDDSVLSVEDRARAFTDAMAAIAASRCCVVVGSPCSIWTPCGPDCSALTERRARGSSVQRVAFVHTASRGTSKRSR